MSGVEFVGISISTKYVDFLRICLEQNQRHFKAWYIVTDPDDHETIDLIRKRGHSNVHVLFYSLSPRFDKSGAVRMAQTIAHSEHPNDWILILDSDIVLPASIPAPTDPLALYGCSRYIFPDRKSWMERRPGRHEPCHNWGFFQLYFDKSKLYPEHSPNASWCDMAFMAHFTNRLLSLPITVDHLGECVVNWNGRVTPPF